MRPSWSSTTATTLPEGTRNGEAAMDASWPISRSLFQGSSQLAALMLEPELLAQQAARIVWHAPQPSLVGQATFALLRRFVGRPRRTALIAFLRLTLLQRALHALALRRIGSLLRLGVGGRGLRLILRRRFRVLLRLRPILLLTGLGFCLRTL